MSQIAEQSNSLLGFLYEALAKAQGQFPVIEKTRNVTVKTKDGGNYSFDYAPLDEIIDATRPALSANGLSVMQLPKVDNGVVSVTTCLAHSSGGSVEFAMSWPVADSARIQDMGGIVTYLRRYALTGMLGVAADSDDDASGAEGTVTQRARTNGKPPCPKCGNSHFVLEDKAVAGQFFCWKNAEKGKLGCGAKWNPAEEAAVKAEQAAAGPPPRVANLTEAEAANLAEKVANWKADILNVQEHGDIKDARELLAAYRKLPDRDLAKRPIWDAFSKMFVVRSWRFDKTKWTLEPAGEGVAA